MVFGERKYNYNLGLYKATLPPSDMEAVLSNMQQCTKK